MSFPRYEKYKDSGVAWLGEVPEHWKIIRLKHNFRLLTEKTVRRENPVALENIESWSGRFIQTESTFEGEGVAFEKGDILFGKLRPYLAKAYLTNASGEAVGDFHVLRPVNDANGKFAQYQLLNHVFIAIVDSSTFGAKMPRVNWDFLGNMVLTMPPDVEQQTIAAFLDRETAKIDALIAEQQRLIELLKEKRQAIISHAVTKGLPLPSPSGRGAGGEGVPMKDSGIEWLGEVPAHWEIVPIKRMTLLITDGAHVSPDTEGGVYDFVSTKDVSESGIDFESSLKTSPASYEYLVRTGCQPLLGDILFSKDGTIGRTVVIDEDREFVVASSLIIIRPDSRILDSTYFNYLCQAFVVIAQVESFVKGAGLPRLSIQNLLKVIGIFPPIQEQKEIATFLDQETTKLDNLTTEAQHAIDLLKERRSALISAAVTGKIDVRGLVETSPESITA